MHLRWRILLFVLAVAVPLTLMTACSSSSLSSGQARATSEDGGTPSDALVQVDSQGNGTLSHVNLMPADGGIAFAPEQRAIERYWQMVYVGVHDHAQGVRTVLDVPMWFDERTKFSGSPGLDFGDTLSEATTHPEWAWDEAGTTDIKFHLQDEVFYLDEVSRPADNASDPNR